MLPLLMISCQTCQSRETFGPSVRESRDLLYFLTPCSEVETSSANSCSSPSLGLPAVHGNKARAKLWRILSPHRVALLSSRVVPTRAVDGALGGPLWGHPVTLELTRWTEPSLRPHSTSSKAGLTELLPFLTQARRHAPALSSSHTFLAHPLP